MCAPVTVNTLTIELSVVLVITMFLFSVVTTKLFSTLSIDTNIGFTTTRQVAVRLEPSVVATVIVASPTPIATTLPSATVAIVESEVDHAIAGLVVFVGNTVAVRVNSSPI